MKDNEPILALSVSSNVNERKVVFVYMLANKSRTDNSIT